LKDNILNKQNGLLQKFSVYEFTEKESLIKEKDP